MDFGFITNKVVYLDFSSKLGVCQLDFVSV